MDDAGVEDIPLIWRILLPLGPDLDSCFDSPFMGAPVPRRFHLLWLCVCWREQRELHRRLQSWYSEDLDAAPGSHKPLARRIGNYPGAIIEEDQAYRHDLSIIQRAAHRLLVLSIPLTRRYVLELRHQYRFFGVGDEVWIGDRNMGRGRDLS